jgi:hypothetical protein
MPATSRAGRAIATADLNITNKSRNNVNMFINPKPPIMIIIFISEKVPTSKNFDEVSKIIA